MPVSQLPRELVESLRRARELEVLASTRDQQLRAVAASGAFLFAAVDAGWSCTALARAMGLRPTTARARVRAARSRYERHSPAIVISEPPPRPLRPLDILKRPVTEREWLTLHEAASHAGRSLEAVRRWRRFGLLPNTQTISPTRMLYLRADLDRVTAAPQYRRGRVDRIALLEQIRRSAV
jgi:hypothetical protein